MSAHTNTTRNALVGAAAVLLTAGSAVAGLLDPGFLMTWDATGDNVGAVEYSPGDFGSAVALNDGSYNYVGMRVGETFELTWDCTVYDNRNESFGPGTAGNAFIDAAFTVTNTSNATQTYSMLMSMNLMNALGAPTMINGSSAHTVTNPAFDGSSTISSPTGGGSIYSAFLDLVDPMTDTPHDTLFDAGYSQTASGAFGTANDSDNFTDLAGPQINNNIAFLVEFDLTAGGQVSLSSLLEVTGVPAPGALALLGIAGLAGRRRRH